MVLEQIYNINFLKQHPGYGFLLGIAYTFIGVVAALLLFPNDPALISVAITSLLLLPSLLKITDVEEELQKTHEPTLRTLWDDNKQIIGLYLTIFFGSFFAFCFLALILPKMAASFMFKQQIGIMFGTGNAALSSISFSSGLFWELLVNNFKVLMLCFFLALVTGNGSIFLIIWNASVWGTIFATLAKTTAENITANPWIIVLLIMLTVLPHVFLEMLSYILAVVSGTVISDGITKENLLGDNMNSILMLNLIVLVAALIVLLIAAGVETVVLNNFETYARIADIAFR